MKSEQGKIKKKMKSSHQSHQICIEKYGYAIETSDGIETSDLVKPANRWMKCGVTAFVPTYINITSRLKIRIFVRRTITQKMCGAVRELTIYVGMHCNTH